MLRILAAEDDSRPGLCSLPALLRGTDIMQAQGGSDQGKMRERLREIAQLPLCAWVVFFREQANIIAQRKQALEQGACFGVPMLQL